MGAVVCWLLYPAIFDVLVDPYCNLQGATVDDCRLLQTEPLEAFSIRLKIAGYGGISLAMPVLLWEVWRFVVPGLHTNEKRWAYPFVGSALVLFALGAALAFHTLTPALEFLTEVGGEGVQQQYRPAPYFELSGDPYTLGIVSVPMYLFYEVSILVGMLLTRRSVAVDHP